MVAGAMAHTSPENPIRDRRLDTYVEDDLYEWVHRQAAAQERTASSWLRFILLRVRKELETNDRT